MNFNGRIFFLLACAFIGLFYSAWAAKSFSLLGFALTVLLIIFALRFEKIRSIFVPFIATTIALSFAELSLSYILPSSQPDTRVAPESGCTKGNGYFKKIVGFGYSLNPGVYTCKKLTSSDEVIFDVIYTIGSDGYRADIPTSIYDAYIYGGSFTFGAGLDDDETLSFYLSNNHNVSIKNVGVGGYGLHQALYNIQQGTTFSGEAGVTVLLTASWHALRSSCKATYALGTPRYVLENNRVSLDGVCPRGDFLARILSKSNIIKLIDRALINKENIITDQDIDLYLGIIDEIAKLTIARNGSLVIAYIDTAEERLSATSWTNESLLERLSNVADSVVDVTLADTREELHPTYYLHELDQHPSAQANIARAILIAEAIQQLKLQ